MWSHTRWIIFAIFLSMSATAMVACKKDVDKAQEDAVKARKEADDRAAEAAKAAREASDKAVAAQKEVSDQAMKASAEARALYQKGIDDAERKLTYLKNKAAKAKGTMKKNAEAAAAEVDKRHQAAKASLAKLETATGTAWDTAKSQAETDIAALNKSVDVFEATLKG